MKSYVYSVYDLGVKAFMSPFFQKNDGLALRGFVAAVNNPETDLNRFSDQFALFKLGEFDDQEGSFKIYDKPERLGLAANFLEKNDDPQVLEIVKQILAHLKK